MMKFLRLLALLLGLGGMIYPRAASADDTPRLRFPVVCNLGVDCWVMNLPDTDPEKGSAKDFNCKSHTYDGHSGTDIALADRAAMETGVDVIAAAAGTVTRLRDGSEDAFRDKAGQDELRAAGRECGNGLIIDHGNNWETQYCHLKKGSFKVKAGDKVKASQTLAQIGLSGITDHPHVHLSVRYKGTDMDPFTGREVKAGCGQKGAPLWGERVPVTSFNLYDAGFAPETPDFALISQGLKPPLPDIKAKKIIFWFAFFAAQKGDRIDMRLLSPSGIVLAEQQLTQEIDRARQYYFTGRVTGVSGNDKGTYHGEARVTRISDTGDTVTETIKREFTLP